MTCTPHTLSVTVDEMGIHEYRIICPDPSDHCPTFDEGRAAGIVPAMPDQLSSRHGGADLHEVNPGSGGDRAVLSGTCFLAHHPCLVDASRMLDVPKSGGEVAAGLYQVVDDPRSPWRLALAQAKTCR